MQLKIMKCECGNCEKVFYEWEDSCLEECPHCEADLTADKSANVIGSQLVDVELDLITGHVTIAGAK